MGSQPSSEQKTGRLALEVDVAIVPLADALSAIHAAACTGRLDFGYREQAKQVWLRGGEVVFACSNVSTDRLGECLLRAGILTLDQLSEAEERHRPPGRFGKALVECGLLTPRQLWNGVRHQVEEIVRSLFCYPGGRASFRVDTPEPDNVVRLALETGRLVGEGLHRREELRRFLEVLEDPRARLERGPGFRGELAGDERRLVERLGEGGPFEEARAALGMERESAARSVQLLRLVGAVRLVRADGPAVGAEAALRERAERESKRVGALAQALAVAEGNDDALEARLARVVEEVASRHPVVLGGLPRHGEVLLHPEPWVERAARVSPTEAGRLAEALAELVAYLEFEVRNHPSIEDPTDILDAPED